MTDTNILNNHLPPSPIAEAVEAESSIWEEDEGQLQPSAPILPVISQEGATLGSNPDMAGVSGYGGLPPSEPLPNPRRSSVTGSYSLPCPPTLAFISEHRQKSWTPKSTKSFGGGGTLVRCSLTFKSTKSLKHFKLQSKNQIRILILYNFCLHYFEFTALLTGHSQQRKSAENLKQCDQKMNNIRFLTQVIVP